MMIQPRAIAFFIAGLMVVVALVLIIDRSGLIAWGALFIGLALLTKIRLRPSKLDPGLAVGLAALPMLAWVGTLNYVISTWESGEVVELTIDTPTGTQTVRLWVLDIGPHPLVYYDAEPEAAKSLLAGTPLQFTRAGKASTRIPEARHAVSLPEVEANLILEAMGTKYGDRNGAADIYYLMLGRSRDRVALVVNLVEK